MSRTTFAIPACVRRAQTSFFSDCRHTPRWTLKGLRTVGYTERVYDGDTVQMVIQPVKQIDEAYRYTCRLAAIQAPEIGHRAKDEAEGRMGKLSRDFLKETIWNRWIAVDVLGQEKYGRLLVDLWLLNDQMQLTTHVNRLMVESGHARVY